MNDIVFTETELLALRRHAQRQAWASHDDLALTSADWMRLAEKLAEAARHAGAVQAAHRAYLAHINAQTLAREADRSPHAAYR